MSGGGTEAATRTNLGFSFDIVDQQVTQAKQVGDIHSDACPNERAICNRILLKQEHGVRPYLGEGEDCDLMVAGTLKRKVKWSVAKKFVYVVGVGYWYLRHGIYSVFKRASSIANSARARV